MADNISITPGAGANVATDDVSGVQFQRVKLDMGGDGVSLPVVGDPTNGLPVDVKRVGGSVTVINPVASNLKVDASGATVPVSAASALPVSAASNAPVAVRLSDGTNPLATLPVSGTILTAQGTASNDAGAWPMKITDGSTEAGITAGALNVNVTNGGGGGTSEADGSTFTVGTTSITPVGGLYNDGAADPTSGQAAVVRVTQKRGLHANLRTAAGVEIGTSGSPVRTDPTGGTTQPVSGTVQGDITKVNGSTIGPTNPLPVTVSAQAQTRVAKAVALTASQTAATVWTPGSGKKFVVKTLILTVSVTGTLTIFDSTSSSANMLYQGTPPVGCFAIPFPDGWPSSTADNVLKYTSGSGLTGDVTLSGYEI